MKDMIIIGSGPAGMSAAVYAKRAMLDVLIVEQEAFCGGQIVNTSEVDNYLGFFGIDGYDMAMKFKEHIDHFEVPVQKGQVTEVKQQGGNWEVKLSDGGTLSSRTVLLAMGAKHRKLQIPGEQEYSGAGVSYCATCDGAFFKKKKVAVVGGGDVALEDALYLSKLCETVYLVHRREELRGAKLLQEQVLKTSNISFLPFYEVREILGEERVTGVRLIENQTGGEKQLDISGIFIAVGMEPDTGYLSDVVERDKTGYIKAQENGVTSAEGIFVAGDCRTKQLRQIATAVSDGANAVASAVKYLSGGHPSK